MHRTGASRRAVPQVFRERARDEDAVERLRGRLRADAVVCCTGYVPPTSRLRAVMSPKPANCETLYKGLWMADVPQAALIGHVYGFVAVPPFAGLQAKYLARVVSGQEALPPRGREARRAASGAKCARAPSGVMPLAIEALFDGMGKAEAEEARLPTQAEEEIPAPVERPSFTRKLSSCLFGEEAPVAESEGVVVEVEPPAMREQGELEPEC